MGVWSGPTYWAPKEIKNLTITKQMVMQKRQELHTKLNDPDSDIVCKRCSQVIEQTREQRFNEIGHVNVAHFTYCNLRCDYCSYTKANDFRAPLYDPLPLLQQFKLSDRARDCWVDLNGGEPTLLPNLKDYIDYFRSINAFISMFTNGVIFSPAIHNGLVDGTINQCIVSLDAGTPETFRMLKRRDSFDEVTNTLRRYAVAANNGKGKLIVKYVFCPMNSWNQDIQRFPSLMKAIRPSQVWLMVDFTPFASDPPIVCDHSREVYAYARIYRELKKLGIDVRHFMREQSGCLTPEMISLQDKIEEEIKGLP
jgi:wyosine [tRNA(Phe)-imidazoG37] synthetase (radical SAM superfamily)